MSIFVLFLFQTCSFYKKTCESDIRWRTKAYQIAVCDGICLSLGVLDVKKDKNLRPVANKIYTITHTTDNGGLTLFFFLSETFRREVGYINILKYLILIFKSFLSFSHNTNVKDYITPTVT